MAARRSESSSMTFLSESISRACSTMPTAPSTILARAATTALACWRCNLHKGPNLTAIDPAGGDVVALFHPRRDAWEAHFVQQSGSILGLTRVGRATVQLLNMNAPRRVALRLALSSERHPPS